jgi:hypothetical protein
MKFFKTSLNNKNSYKITPHFIFCPKNDGVVAIFSFLLLRPSKTSEALKKGPNFGFLTLEYALKKLDIGSGLYGKSVLYLMCIGYQTCAMKVSNYLATMLLATKIL